MNRRHDFIGFGCNDGEGLQPAVGWIFPSVSKTEESHHVAVGQVEPERLFILRVQFLPFVKPRGRNYATPSGAASEALDATKNHPPGREWAFLKWKGQGFM